MFFIVLAVIAGAFIAIICVKLCAIRNFCAPYSRRASAVFVFKHVITCSVGFVSVVNIIFFLSIPCFFGCIIFNLVLGVIFSVVNWGKCVLSYLTLFLNKEITSHKSQNCNSNMRTLYQYPYTSYCWARVCSKHIKPLLPAYQRWFVLHAQAGK